MAIGRISGSVLKSNLTRNGTDLAFETNLLYLDVTNSRIGIGTSEPTTTLHVNGDTNITGDLTGVTDITASGTTQTDIIKNRQQLFTTSNVMKFNQLYTGAASGSYFTNGEYQKVVTITPSGDSQNYQVIGRITAQNAGETHVVNFNAALRSNTLPDLDWTILYDEEYNGSRYIDPQLWTKETTTAGFIFAFKTLATIYGTVTVDFDVIPRNSTQLANVSINTTQNSEQTSVDAGFTANDMTRVLRKQGSTFNVNGNTTITGDLSLSGSFSPGSISLSDNIITTNTSNADLELTANGSGNVAIKSTRIQYVNPKYIIKEYILYGTTTDALETEIFVNGTSNNRIPIQTDSTVNYTVDFTARRTDVDGTSAGYQLKGVIDNNSGTVADVGNVYEIMVSEDDVNLAVDARADNTNKSLDIFVQGTSGATFAWLACVKTYEVIE